MNIKEVLLCLRLKTGYEWIDEPGRSYSGESYTLFELSPESRVGVFILYENIEKAFESLEYPAGIYYSVVVTKNYYETIYHSKGYTNIDDVLVEYKRVLHEND